MKISQITLDQWMQLAKYYGYNVSIIKKPNNWFTCTLSPVHGGLHGIHSQTTEIEAISGAFVHLNIDWYNGLKKMLQLECDSICHL